MTDMIDQICRVDRTRQTWIDSITPEQRETCEQVRDRVRAENLPRMTVAKNLIQHMELSVTPQTVIRWFDQT